MSRERVVTKRQIAVGMLVVIGVASFALLAYVPLFIPVGTVETRSIDTESAHGVTAPSSR
jgi:hypothetical protein